MKIIGHRGARNEAPENTVEGFIHAQQNGCQHFELDIQLSSDKELIVYHDKTLKRTSGLNQKLSQLPYAQLSKIDARLNTPGWETPCFIASLEEVFLAVPNTISWQFEVKTGRRDSLIIILDKLISFIKAYNLYEKCHVTSTNKWFLKCLKLKEPKIEIGFVCEYLHQRPVQSCIDINASLLVLNEKLASKKIIAAAEAANIEVSCWTVNDISKIDKLLSFGIKSIITDQPTHMIAHYL
jgi:glycerophosphoryl diester phosphodiesterase